MRFTFVNNGESGGTGVLLSGAGGVPGEGEGAGDGEGPKKIQTWVQSLQTLK